MRIVPVLPHGIKDAPYLQTVRVQGGEPPYTITADLPEGLSMTDTGEISGTPIKAGAYPIEFTLSDPQHTTTQVMPLLIHEAAASKNAEIFIALSAPNGQTGVLDAEQFAQSSVDGMDNIIIHHVPRGGAVEVTIAYPEKREGQVYMKHGPTPENPEPHDYVMPDSRIQGNIAQFTLIDGGWGDDSLEADGNIIDPGGPGIPLNTIDGAVPAVLPISEPLRVEFQALCSGGECPANSVYEWSLISGSLPSGVTLTGSGRTGVLSGTPTQVGRYPFTVQVLARGSVVTTTSKSFTTDIIVNPVITTLITHYYVAILNREPDASGLAYWQTQASAPGANVKQVFRNMGLSFFGSAEYLGRNRSNAQLISDLYLTFLHRSADQSGLTYWLGQLSSGVSRNSVAASFAYSAEFTNYMNSIGL
ncbi:MAG: DUF4214 domain-containing protein [Candidatus Competibacteraceae bacterium]|nr:DUF4214 domain-containing protein [Candidatus Competibacteraceae bacterium]